METKLVSLDSLVRARNYQHRIGSLIGLVQSIRTNGYDDDKPIGVDESGRVIHGWRRVQALCYLRDNTPEDYAQALIRHPGAVRVTGPRSNGGIYRDSSGVIVAIHCDACSMSTSVHVESEYDADVLWTMLSGVRIECQDCPIDYSIGE